MQLAKSLTKSLAMKSAIFPARSLAKSQVNSLA